MAHSSGSGRPYLVGEEPYSPKTLQGNWFEERCDTKTVLEPKPLPSQHAHYYETTYAAAYNKDEKVPKRTTLEKEPHIYPGHQPELDPPGTKFIPKSCYMIDYVDPNIKRNAMLVAMKRCAEKAMQPEEQGTTRAKAFAGHSQFKWGPTENRNIPQSTYMVDYMAPGERRKALRDFLDKTDGGTKKPPTEDKVTKPALLIKVPPVSKKQPKVFSTYRPEPGPPQVQFVHKSTYMQDYVEPNLNI